MRFQLLGPGDAALLERVAAEVFDNPLDPGWTAQFLADPRHHMAVALADEEVIGMASAVHYVHPDKPPELWINEVGVAPPHRRRGVGRRLLGLLFDHGRSLGCKEAWVATEVDNGPARRLYLAAGGTEAGVVVVSFNLSAPV